MLVPAFLVSTTKIYKEAIRTHVKNDRHSMIDHECPFPPAHPTDSERTQHFVLSLRSSFAQNAGSTYNHSSCLSTRHCTRVLECSRFLFFSSYRRYLSFFNTASRFIFSFSTVPDTRVHFLKCGQSGRDSKDSWDCGQQGCKVAIPAHRKFVPAWLPCCFPLSLPVPPPCLPHPPIVSLVRKKVFRVS